MTLTDNPDGQDLAADEAELSTISNLSVGLPGTFPEGNTLAEQGDAPTDLAERPAPGVPTPSRDALSAEEVARLAGDDEASTDEASTDANNSLDRAEGVTPDDED